MSSQSLDRNFETLGVIVRQGSQDQSAQLHRILSALQRHGRLMVHLLDGCDCLDGHPPATLEQIAAGADLAVSVGGDGTLLAAARALVDSGIPLVGINLGRLGFLADVTLDAVESHLEGIFAGRYSMERRFLLEGSIETDGQRPVRQLALNDIVLHGHESISMIEFEVFSNGQLINRQRADGLIVSTPTGSTAYALSGGGPIMHPALEAIALVPICPHTLSHRPIALPSDQQIEIRLSQTDSIAQVSFDGQHRSLVGHRERLRVTRYPHPVTLLHPEDYDYYHILRAKLNWSNQP
jgi:NAD+ kinase